jgi:hypothetical protein
VEALLQEVRRLWCWKRMVAIVRAHNLDMVEAQSIVIGVGINRWRIIRTITTSGDCH